MKQDIGTVIEDPQTTTSSEIQPGDLEDHDPRFAFISLRDTVVGICLVIASLAIAAWWLFQPSQSSRGIRIFPTLESMNSEAPLTTKPFKARVIREIPDSEIGSNENPQSEVPAVDEPVDLRTPVENKSAPSTPALGAPVKLRIRPTTLPLNEPMGLPNQSPSSQIPMGVAATNAIAKDEAPITETVIVPKTANPTTTPLGYDGPTTASSSENSIRHDQPDSPDTTK